MVTAEEHQYNGGLGDSVAQYLAMNHPTPMEFVGVNDSFGESGKPAELMEKYGLNAESGGVKSTLRIFCKKLKEARVGNNVTSKTSANDYFKPFVLSAWNKKGYMMDIDEYCSQYNLPRQDITSYKLVSHTGTPFYNIVFKTKEEFKDDLTEDFIDAAIKKYIKPQKPFLVRGITSPHTLRIVITDTHIGMETDASGFGLYGGIWNKEELFARGETILYEVMHYAVMFDYFEEIHLIDLMSRPLGADGSLDFGRHRCVVGS